MPVNRRRFLATIGAGTAAGLAGCGGSNTPVARTIARPSLGTSTADVTVRGFFDYLCPHCQDWFNNVFQDLKDRHINPSSTSPQIEFEYWEYPVVNAYSEVIPNIALDIYQYQQKQPTVDQDQEFFNYIHDFHDQLEPDTAPETIKDALFSVYTEKTGFPREKFETVWNSQPHAKAVTHDKTIGTRSGIDATPQLIVGDEVVESADDLDRISSVIRTEAN